MRDLSWLRGVGLTVTLITEGICPALAGAENPAVRTVSVTIVADAGFRAVPQWRGMARTIVARATSDLAVEAGLAFEVVEEVPWDPPRDLSTLRDVLDAAEFELGPVQGVLAVLLGRAPPDVAGSEERGFGYLGRPALVVLAPDFEDVGPPERFKRFVAMLLRHELAHVFGVPHTSGKTIMNPKPELRQFAFGPLEREILRANRGMDLTAGRPFVGSDLETLRDVYTLLDDRGEAELSLLVNTGVALYGERHYADARMLFERALRRDRHSLTALTGMAQTVVALGDTATGIRITNQLMEIDPLTPDLKGIIGGLWLKFGEYDLAEGFLTEALEEGNPRFSVPFNRGLLRFHQDRFQEAKPDFELALTREERPEGWFNLGLTCDALERGKEAAAAFTRYLELVPGGPNSDEARKFLERWK